MAKVALIEISDKPLPPDELKAWRWRNDLTQETAAEWLGVSVRTYENWEQGHREMRHPIAVRRLSQLTDKKRLHPRQDRKNTEQMPLNFKARP